MALTLTRVPNFDDVYGRTLVRTFDVTFDTSYPLSAGYSVAARDVGLSAFKGIKVVGGNKAAGGVIVALDLGTGTGNAPLSAALRVFTPTGGATGAASPAAPTFAEGAITNGAITPGTFTVAAGATPVTSTAANGTGIVSESTPSQAASSIAAGVLTAGVAKEFANGANLSTITARIEFSGF